MKANIKFIKLDMESMPEPELVFEIIPRGCSIRARRGCGPKNKWLINVAKGIVDERCVWFQRLELEERINQGRETITEVWGIEHEE